MGDFILGAACFVLAGGHASKDFLDPQIPVWLMFAALWIRVAAK